MCNSCRCIRLASTKAEEVVAFLKAALEQHEVSRVQARVRRHREAPPPANQGPSSCDVIMSEVAKAAELGTKSCHSLVAELGIDLLGDMSEESSNDSNDDAGGNDIVEGRATQSHSRATQQKSKSDGPSAVAKLKTPAPISVLSKAPEVISPPPSSSMVGKKAKPTLPKRSPELKYDELENIAAIIAGAGLGGQDEDIKELGDAVKSKGKGATPRKKK